MLALLSIQFGKLQLQFHIVSWCLLGMNNENNITHDCANSKKCQVEKDEYVASKGRLSGLMISGMALSNQSTLSPFLSPRKAN